MTKKSENARSNKQQYSVGGIVVTLVLVFIYWWLTGSLPNLEDPQSSATTGSDTGGSVAVAVTEDITATMTVPTTETPPAAVVTVATASTAEEDPPTAAPTAQAQSSTVVEEHMSTVTALPPDPSPTAVPATATPAPTSTATIPPPPTATPANPPRAGPPGMPEIQPNELPPEALDTVALIATDGPFPFDRDGITFQNREGLLPNKPRGYYREYTVITPGANTRGARRIVTGADGEFYYTDDHYASFFWVVVP